MGRFATALIGAAGDALVSVSREAAEARKLEALEAIREKYAQADHARQLERDDLRYTRDVELEGTRHQNTLEATTHQNQLIEGRPDLLTAEQGLFIRRGDQVSPLTHDGTVLTGPAKERDRKLAPEVAQATELLKELYKVDTFGWTPEQMAAHQSKIAALEARAGMGAGEASTASATAQGTRTPSDRLGRVMQELESGNWTLEDARKQIFSAPPERQQEAEQLWSAVQQGFAQKDKQPESAPTPTKAPQGGLIQSVGKGVDEELSSGGRGESLQRVQDRMKSPEHIKGQIQEREAKIERLRAQLKEVSASVPDGDAEAGRMKTTKSAINKGIAALQSEIKDLKAQIKQ